MRVNQTILFGVYLTLGLIYTLLVLPERFRLGSAVVLSLGLILLYAWHTQHHPKQPPLVALLAGGFALWLVALLQGLGWWMILWLGVMFNLLIIQWEANPPPFLPRYHQQLRLLAAIPPSLAILHASRFLLKDLFYSEAQTALQYVVLSIVLCIPLLWLNPPTLFRHFEALPPPAYPIRWWAVGAGGFLLWLWGESNTYRLGYEWEFYPAVEFALMLSGLGLLLWAFWQGRFRLDFRSRDTGLLLIIVGVALGMRLWQLETKVHSFVDEIHFANGVNQFSAEEHPDTRLLMPFQTVTAFPRLYPFLEYLAVQVFSPSLSSLRLVSVIIGSLSVVAVYFLGRELGDWQTGLGAGLICATFPPHVFFSRLALNNIADPLFGVLAALFLLRGLKSNRPFEFAAAGVCLGLTQYFYEGGKLLFPPLILLWMIFLAIFHRRLWRGSLVMGMTALLSILPLYYTITGADQALTPRLDTQLISFQRWQWRLDSDNNDHHGDFLNTWLLYTSIPDKGWFYGGNEALILPYLVPLALLGVGIVVVRWRSPAGLLLPMWVIATSVSNSWLLDSAWVPRYVVVFPAVALLLGIAWRYLTAHLPPVFALAILALICFYQSDYLFNRHYTERLENIHEIDVLNALLRVPEFPPETEVYVVFEGFILSYNIETFRDFFDLPNPITFYFAPTAPTNWVEQTDPNVPNAFFVNAEDHNTIAAIQAVYGELPLETRPHHAALEKQLVLLLAEFNCKDGVLC